MIKSFVKKEAESYKHAWYSYKQFKAGGGAIYLSKNGNSIFVTEVSENATTNSKWDDMHYLGLVTKYLGKS